MKKGYVNVTGTGHPLAWGKNLTVGEHRMVLWEKIGPGPHKCHWCGCRLVWAPTKQALPEGTWRLLVDHLDDDRSNNDPSNLVPSCLPCNVLRSTPMAGRRRKRKVREHRKPVRLYKLPLPSSMGPARKVVRQLPHEGVMVQGAFKWRYELECGHVVLRKGAGRSLCYCEQCA